MRPFVNSEIVSGPAERASNWSQGWRGGSKGGRGGGGDGGILSHALSKAQALAKARANPPKSDWTCRGCEAAVFGSKTECFRCGLAKGKAPPKKEKEEASVAVGMNRADEALVRSALQATRGEELLDDGSLRVGDPCLALYEDDGEWCDPCDQPNRLIVRSSR